MTLLEYFVENERLRTEWAYDLNTEIPSALDRTSHKKVWWRCDKGHEWQATVYARVYQESNCHVCVNVKIAPGINDLATLRPDLASQWHPTLNGKLTPQMVSRSSGKRIWWRCGKGHEWRATVASRTNGGTGCPCCVGLRVIPGETDLLTLYPDVAAQWDYELNGDSDPGNVSASSHKKVWWRCEKGHSWQAMVFSRTVRKSRCPYCYALKVIPGVNDLATLYPELMKEWHPERNGDLDPIVMTPGSQKKVWWQCANGHEWQAAIDARAKRKTGCPYCSGRYVVSGVNDLATLRPDLAVQWHPTLNGDLKPIDVSCGSKREVWWQCTNGHEWQAETFVRTFMGTGCPYCSGKRTIPGVNDLATLRPDLAAQWHPTLNGDLKPTDVKPGSDKNVWWRCEESHEWQAKVSARARPKKSPCPICAGTPKKNQPKELPRPKSTP